jgi:hypothetical protein
MLRAASAQVVAPVELPSVSELSQLQESSGSSPVATTCVSGLSGGVNYPLHPSLEEVLLPTRRCWQPLGVVVCLPFAMGHKLPPQDKTLDVTARGMSPGFHFPPPRVESSAQLGRKLVGLALASYLSPSCSLLVFHMGEQNTNMIN